MVDTGRKKTRMGGKRVKTFSSGPEDYLNRREKTPGECSKRGGIQDWKGKAHYSNTSLRTNKMSRATRGGRGGAFLASKTRFHCRVTKVRGLVATPRGKKGRRVVPIKNDHSPQREQKRQTSL